MAARRVARAAQASRLHCDINREPRTRFAPKPFYTREVINSDVALGPHRVWVDNLPYDTALRDVIDCFGKTCRITGATLFRPPLSAATLKRRHIAEQDASERQMLLEKSRTARTASNAAKAAFEQNGTPRQQKPGGKKRGRPKGRAQQPSMVDEDGENFFASSGAGRKESSETLEITRHGDFNALRCFGFLHVAEEIDRLKALSRSLRIFGIAFRGRQCPTIDENLKRILYLGGLPPSHGRQDAVLDFLAARAGHLLTSAVEVVHPYEYDQENAAHGPMSALTVQRATVERNFLGAQHLAAPCGQFLVQVQCAHAARELLRRLVKGDCDSYICTPMLNGHPVMARWADSSEERYLHATRRTEYELLNDED